ncbi:MAG: spermidine/putrescine ABC transporter substrate-binding protein [Actinobacteria bacterium]|nr:spermidine/putrescine ABC transporter substrate-binding protein [Actinomycetota bacterium]
MGKNPFGGLGAGELWRHGKLTRRRFLQYGGITLGAAALAACAPEKERETTTETGAKDLGDRLVLVTWPNYHELANFEAFEKATGVKVDVKVFGSNEEMLAKLQVGSTGWDVFVPTNYTITTYADLGLIEPMDLSRIPNYDSTKYEQRFLDASKVPGDDATYAIPKNWGTTGYAYWSDEVPEEPTTWKEFWDNTMGPWSGKVTIHDYMLTTIGNALKYYGYSFNSIDPDELAKAEEVLLEAKPHLFGITSDYQPPMRAKDAWVSMAWTGDALQMNRDEPDIKYVLGREGGELWEDNWAIVPESARKDAAYAFLDFMIDPQIAAKETLFHGYPQVDQRATDLLPDEILTNPIVYPAPELLEPLEFGAAATLTSPARSELWARVKAA